jgi:outer membrane protein assembly factor BamD (BamD/ComL family)
VVTPAPQAARSASSSVPSADLGEQIRLIEAARAGVAAHDAKAAMAALDTYAAKFPRGSFGQEAMVLRIRAIDQSGNLPRATALAKSFVARFPNSPHVARLKPIAERGASR